MKNGIKITEVLDSRKKVVVYPGFGCNPAILDDVISLGHDEITLRKPDIGYVKRNSISKRYEGSPRYILENHLKNINWKQWPLDDFIWLSPNHNYFK